MQVKNLQKQKGFTLVEIAIVLVIIGLLLGGVLKGQELITNAKIKSVTSDFDNIIAGAYAYQDRTGHLPGDSSDGTLNGTFDGQIANDQFWKDLRTQGFINGLSSGASGPTHSLDGSWTAGYGGVFPNKNWICASNIIDTYGQGIDQKKDDGDGTTGSMRSVADGTTTPSIAYGTTGSNAQTVCHEL